jgi:hypothetical protein
MNDDDVVLFWDDSPARIEADVRREEFAQR